MYMLSIIVVVIIEMPVLWLIVEWVIFHYSHLSQGDCSRGLNFKTGALRLIDVTEEEINMIEEN